MQEDGASLVRRSAALLTPAVACPRGPPTVCIPASDDAAASGFAGRPPDRLEGRSGTVWDGVQTARSSPAGCRLIWILTAGRGVDLLDVTRASTGNPADRSGAISRPWIDGR